MQRHGARRRGGGGGSLERRRRQFGGDDWEATTHGTLLIGGGQGHGRVSGCISAAAQVVLTDDISGGRCGGCDHGPHGV